MKTTLRLLLALVVSLSAHAQTNTGAAYQATATPGFIGDGSGLLNIPNASLQSPQSFLTNASSVAGAGLSLSGGVLSTTSGGNYVTNANPSITNQATIHSSNLLYTLIVTNDSTHAFLTVDSNLNVTTTGSLTVSNSSTTTVMLTNGDAYASHLMGMTNGGFPKVTLLGNGLGTSAGTNAYVTNLTAISDTDFTVAVVTQNSPAITSNIFFVQFGRPFANNKPPSITYNGVNVNWGNTAGARTCYVDAAQITTNGFWFVDGATALNGAGVLYLWTFHCAGSQ